jgi:hypothetical protein
MFRPGSITRDQQAGASRNVARAATYEDAAQRPFPETVF